MEIIGKIKMIGEVQHVGDSFRKRDLVVTTEEQYPQHILIEFNQDKSDLLNGLNIGQDVKVHYNLRGREWVNPQGETKYFNSIQGWKLEIQNFAPVTSPNSNNAQTETNPQSSDSIAANEEDNGDLPF